MSSQNPIDDRLPLPANLMQRLHLFRRRYQAATARVTLILLISGLLLMFWIMLIADRLIDVPREARLTAGAVVVVGVICVMIQSAFQIMSLNQPRSIIHRIGDQQPELSDSLLGAIELAEEKQVQSNSRSLRIAAIAQVAQKADQICIENPLLPSFWTRLASNAPRFVFLPLLILLGMGIWYPGLVMNTLQRWGNPFADTTRFTFVQLADVPVEMIVPHDEVSPILIDLAPQSVWKPKGASLILPTQIIRGPRQSETRYLLEVPRLIEPTKATLRIGDATTRLTLIPKQRPALAELQATIRLPSYFTPDSDTRAFTRQSIVGETVTALQGSEVELDVTTTSELGRFEVDGESRPTNGDASGLLFPNDRDTVSLRWCDRDQLWSAEPTVVQLRTITDQPPLLLFDGGATEISLLSDQPLTFDLLAEDDFAVRRVGIEWAVGGQTRDRVLDGYSRVVDQGPMKAAELPKEQRRLTWKATFLPTAFGVDSGSANLRFWAEDDLPGRPRVYSRQLTVTVLSNAEHAVWIDEQLNQWRETAMNVRDEELRLLQRNRELAAVEPAKRDGDWAAEVLRQAGGERLNTKRLAEVVETGTDLLRNAASNSQIDASTVESLARSIKSLQVLADQRMPELVDRLQRVAELAEQSKFEELANTESSLGANAAGNEGESTQVDDAAGPVKEQVGLAGTTIVDTSQRNGGDKVDADESKDDTIEEAIEEQLELVAEFDLVADQLRELMSKMEDSTLVKRLKAISRMEERIAAQIARSIDQTFGGDAKRADALLLPVRDQAIDAAERMTTVLYDLQAFYDRREIDYYGAVLKELKSMRAVDRLRSLPEQLLTRPGITLARAEFWADNLDRLADDLVDPGEKKNDDEPQQDEGPEESKSLPPKIVLDVLRILDSEVNLREQTRQVERSRAVSDPNAYMGQAIKLSEDQDLLRDRLDVVVDSIASLTNGRVDFAEEIEVLDMASAAMVDATKTLVQPETGPVAMAAQTESIELLLRSRKVDQDSDNSSGGSAGNGDGGETSSVAAELIEAGLNELARDRVSDTKVSAGRRQAEVPERWRPLVDEYYRKLEQRQMTTETQP